MQARKESAEDGGLDESEDRREMGMYANLVGEYERSGVVKKALMALALLTMMGIAMAVMASPAQAADFTLTNTNDSGDGSLREAITQANDENTNPGADAITFAIPAGDTGCTSADGCTITLESTLPSIQGDLSIDGQENRITVSGSNAVQVLAVRSVAQLDLRNLTVANGRASYGGGIYNAGTLTVTNSTFSGNSATTFFGGGGIYNSSGTATLSNTIVANSSAGGNCFGTITDGGGNLDDGSTCGFSETSSQSNANDGLDPDGDGLKDNGGPTKTIALLPDSDAIDAGVKETCAASPVNNLDQRGVIRPQGSACDIGSFELEQNAAPTLTVVGGGACGTNARSGTINLIVADANDGASNLKLTASSPSSPKLVSGVTFGGSGNNRTATISTLSGRTGNATVTITVSDAQTSTSVPVTVTASGNGNDTITGTDGTDLLLAQNGDDRLSGLGANDLLCAGRGNDRLGGGSGADTFDGGPGIDVTTDFNALEGDSRTNIP